MESLPFGGVYKRVPWAQQWRQNLSIDHNNMAPSIFLRLNEVIDEKFHHGNETIAKRMKSKHVFLL